MLQDFTQGRKKHKKHHLKIILLLAFCGVLGLLILTSFYGNFQVTGKIIKSLSLSPSNSAGNSTLLLNAELTIPNLEVDGTFDQLELTGSSDTYIIFGGQKYYLGNLNENYFVIYDYGKISFNPKNISELSGKSSGIRINGVLVEPSKGSTAKVSLNNSFKYKSIDIIGNAEIKKLSYNTSGSLITSNEKNVFKLDQDGLTINGFTGNISVEENELILNGRVNSIDIEGDSIIHIEGK